MENVFKPRGIMMFCYHDNEIQYIARDFNKNEKEYKKYTIYDLMAGEDFYESVNDGCITDYDGKIVNVFVDGYVSNLGLLHNGLCDGDFLVDGNAFLDICERYDVQVNWANK